MSGATREDRIRNKYVSSIGKKRYDRGKDERE